MRRSVLALTWAIGTTMAVVLAWWSVSIVGDQVVPMRDAPVHEALDVPRATTGTTKPAGPRVPVLDPDVVDSITANLDAATTTTTLPPDIVTAPPPDAVATTVVPRSPTPTSAPTSAPAAPTTADTPPSTADEVTATTAAPAPPPTTPPATSPPTSSPPATTPTTTTAPRDDTEVASQFPAGWDRNATLEPRAEGTQTFRFDCGSITIHWRNYHVARLSGTLDERDQACVEQYGGVVFNFHEDREQGEVVFIVHYPDGDTDTYRMAAQRPPGG